MNNFATKPRHPEPSSTRPLHIEAVHEAPEMVPRRRGRPSVLYAFVSVLGIGVIAFSQLLLTIATSQGAYEISSLQQQQKELSRASQFVYEDLSRVKSSQYLAANAEALGMVRNSNPVYLRLSDGAIFGSPVPAAPGAGVVMGATGSQVPNSLIDKLPLVTQQSVH